MKTDEFERLNYLSDKAINETATAKELAELDQLLELWNYSVELNLFLKQRNLAPPSK